MGGRGRGRVKRKQVQSEDGWTVITHGLSNLSLDKGQGEGRRKREGQDLDTVGSMPSTVQGLTIDTLMKDFEKRQERWRDTACARQVKDLLCGRTWDVQEAVCIGIGSFSRDWEHRHRCMWQLVLFMEVVGHRTFSPPLRKLFFVLM